MSKNNFVVNREERSYIVTLIFDAPRELVWKVYTDPALVPRWWGPKRLTTTVDKMEVRPGGVWRYIQKDAEGNDYAFNGVYKEVDAPKRLISTFEFEGMAGHIATDTVTFEELPDGKTKVISRSTVDSLEALEAIVQPGMEEGAIETWERFGEVVATLQAEQKEKGL
jgi:uncharacterized protein YndB with AHSA1/START domain